MRRLHAMLLEMACAWNTIFHCQKSPKIVRNRLQNLLSQYVQEVMSMNIRRFLVMGKLAPKLSHSTLLTFSSPDSKIGGEQRRSISECTNIWQTHLESVILDVARFGISEQNTCHVNTATSDPTGTKASTGNHDRPGFHGLGLQAAALAQLKRTFETEEFVFKNNRFRQAWKGSGKIGGIVQHLEMMYLIGNQVYKGLRKGKVVMSDLLNWKHVIHAAITYSLMICFILFRLHEYLLTLALWGLALNMLSYRFKKKIKRIQVKTRHKNIIDYINMAVYAGNQVSTATNLIAETNRLLLKLRCLFLGTSKNNSMRFVWFLVSAMVLTAILPMTYFLVLIIILNFVAAYNFVRIWQRVGVWWDQVCECIDSRC